MVGGGRGVAWRSRATLKATQRCAFCPSTSTTGASLRAAAAAVTDLGSSVGACAAVRPSPPAAPIKRAAHPPPLLPERRAESERGSAGCVTCRSGWCCQRHKRMRLPAATASSSPLEWKAMHDTTKSKCCRSAWGESVHGRPLVGASGRAGPEPLERRVRCVRRPGELRGAVSEEGPTFRGPCVRAETLPRRDVPDAHGLVKRARGQQPIVVRVELDGPRRALVPRQNALDAPRRAPEHLRVGNKRVGTVLPFEGRAGRARCRPGTGRARAPCGP